MKSYAVTSNLYPETTIKEPIDRSGTIPSRSTLHSLRNISVIDNNNVGPRNTGTLNSRDSNRDNSRPSLFSRNNQEPDLTSFKTLEDDDYGFKSRFSPSMVIL